MNGKAEELRRRRDSSIAIAERVTTMKKRRIEEENGSYERMSECWGVERTH
jgi:hypothetical protein